MTPIAGVECERSPRGGVLDARCIPDAKLVGCGPRQKRGSFETLRHFFSTAQDRLLALIDEIGENRGTDERRVRSQADARLVQPAIVRNELKLPELPRRRQGNVVG